MFVSDCADLGHRRTTSRSAARTGDLLKQLLDDLDVIAPGRLDLALDAARRRRTAREGLASATRGGGGSLARPRRTRLCWGSCGASAPPRTARGRSGGQARGFIQDVSARAGRLSDDVERGTHGDEELDGDLVPGDVLVLHRPLRDRVAHDLDAVGVQSGGSGVDARSARRGERRCTHVDSPRPANVRRPCRAISTNVLRSGPKFSLQDPRAGSVDGQKRAQGQKEGAHIWWRMTTTCVRRAATMAFIVDSSIQLSSPASRECAGLEGVRRARKSSGEARGGVQTTGGTHPR